ncbi:hypothetical protein [Pseudomonas aphyarum]|uniref:hypothetical protein n=1 Tax=Pseudomonas aphyarum TaxID=2942629 RepID=UPI00236114BC|nr:hypothetical protein [Pseudomonas aphyarum]MDD0972303.1 hypothetical protein [Pseudomonas aphyarum]
MTDAVCRATEPVLELFAIEIKGAGKAVEFLLDAGDGIHQRISMRMAKRKTGSNMCVPSRKNQARDFAGDQSEKKSGK